MTFIQYMRAHGSDPSPTQRPLLAGAITGVIASVPVSAILRTFQASSAIADLSDIKEPFVLAAAGGATVLLSMLYARLLGRVANDRRSGWLLGISFGFLVWMACPVLIQEHPLRGTEAMAVLLAELAGGLTLGAFYPFIHEPLMSSIAGPRRGFRHRSVGNRTLMRMLKSDSKGLNYGQQ
jgi:hypothetical protein